MSKNANDLKKKEQVKKWLVYSAMVIACAVFVWFIFNPSKKQLQTEQQNTGLNTQLPAPRNAGIEADKITAYELDDMRVRQEQKMMTLEDFAAKISDEGQERNIEDRGYFAPSIVTPQSDVRSGISEKYLKFPLLSIVASFVLQ